MRGTAAAVDASLRRSLYLNLHTLAQIPIRRTYSEIRDEQQMHAGPEVTRFRLRELLRHCRSNVPYYSRLLSGIDLDANPIGALQRLPILTRRVLREQGSELMSADLSRRRWYWNASGGSTGEPVRVVQDANYTASAVATEMLFHESVGRRIGERAVFLWGSEREVLRGNADPKLRLLRLLANTVTVNSFRLTPEAILDFVRLINATRPKLIVGYAQSLFEVARFVGRESIGIEPQRAIIASAGTLYEFMRDAIEHALDCRVTNQYGSREVGPVALECAARSGLHVAPWNTHVEVLGPEGVPVGPGDEGELVITSLTNYAMPLLRYAVGDVGTLAQPTTCRCGHSGTTLARITGRVVDTFRTASGANVDGEYFTHLIYHLDWVEKFQVVQRTLRSVVFRIVLADHRPPPEPELERITAGTRAALGEDCEVDFEFVDELVPGPSGKFRFTISEVKPVE